MNSVSRGFAALVFIAQCIIPGHALAATAVTRFSQVETGDLITKGPWVDVRAYSSLSAAVADAGTAGKTILIGSAVAVNDNLTIPSDRAVQVIKGGSINVAAGKTLTINCPFVADAYRIFTGSGTVTFSASSYVVRHDEWWGSQLNNLAIGHGALAKNTTGSVNIAIGAGALASTTVENYSVAIGVDALNAYIGVPASENTAVGSVALKRLTTGNNNTALGSDCLPYTTVGNNNTGLGQFAGYANTTGDNNTFAGNATGKDNTTGSNNTYLGYRAGALDYATTGSYNTYLGVEAGPESAGASPGSAATLLHHATGVGYYAKPKVSNSLILGGAVEHGQSVKVGIGTGSPATALEIFGVQSDLHSAPKDRRGLLAIYDASGHDLPNGNPAVPQANAGAGITLGGWINATELSSWVAVMANKYNAVVDDGRGYLDIYTADSSGSLSAKVRVFPNGDVELKTAGAGLIMTSPDGQRTRKITLSNSSDSFVFAEP